MSIITRIEPGDQSESIGKDQSSFKHPQAVVVMLFGQICRQIGYGPLELRESFAKRSRFFHRRRTDSYAGALGQSCRIIRHDYTVANDTFQFHATPFFSQANHL